jgi:dGTPase
MQIYKELLTGDRFRKSEAGYDKLVTNAESDRGRLIYCPAFRRLQQKAQVFSLEPNAAVRSRLTHSLEVAQMGRYIADQIVVKLKESKLADENECAAIVSFVETACLMHDIGNPPFGHFGEAAIQEWFRTYGKNLVIESCGKNLSEPVEIASEKAEKTIADFIEFDGNPQGLRIVTKLQRNADEYGLNLTKTTLASYLKYIRSSNEEKGNGDQPFIKKCCYFQTESDLVNDIWKEFKYLKPQRFPLAYIMEAADDLAYCISDLEDSIEKGLIRKKDAIECISRDLI